MTLRELLENVRSGRVTLEEAERLLSGAETLFLRDNALDCVREVARLDPDREQRTGIPEVVLAQGKEPQHAAELTIRLAQRKGRALATRISPAVLDLIRERLGAFPDYTVHPHESARAVVVAHRESRVEKCGRSVGLLAAGTADFGVAEEARVTMEEMGCDVLTAYDVGVAGLHRLFAPLEEMKKADVDALVVVAGMEGALPTVVKALVEVPVIGVPTSVGYGYGGGGQAALMGMLQSCSPGLVVVNIDNGFGAGAAAALIARRAARGGPARPSEG